MATTRRPYVVLADACVLVKDVVSHCLFDLHAAGLIELYWTPEIEAEYIEHRARLRAASDGLKAGVADLMWASNRIEVVKKYLVKESMPPGWSMEKTLLTLAGQERYAPLQRMSDKDDFHVAAAAGYLADRLGRVVLLVSSNLDDFPQTLLTPMNSVAMHPGTLLDLLYDKEQSTVSASLLKTSSDFQNPPISPASMLLSISGSEQFNNPELARRLAKTWAEQVKSKTKT
jgi:hypothetical protein